MAHTAAFLSFLRAGDTWDLVRHPVQRHTWGLWLPPPSQPLLTPLSHRLDVEQMAIDWLTGNFYFVDDIDDRIFVCNKNGVTCVTLLDLELYNPKGIALDPAMG